MLVLVTCVIVVAKEIYPAHDDNTLSPQQGERIHQAVASGNYASNSEVLRDALRRWEQRQEETAYLKQAYEEGIASGPAVSIERETLLKSFHEKAQN